MPDDVSNTVRNVESIDHKPGADGGALNAYRELKKEYDQYAQTHSAADTATYWKEVTTELVNDNVLPDLAIGWGKDHNVDGYSAADLTDPYRYDFAGAPASYNFDKELATQLASQMDDLADLRGDTSLNGSVDLGPLHMQFGDDADHIHMEEIDKYLTNVTVKNEQSLLFQGTPPLIQVLDQANAGDGKLDGQVTPSDMNRFIQDYNRLTNNGTLKAPEGSPYTAENAQYVQDILDGKHENIAISDKSLTDRIVDGISSLQTPAQIISDGVVDFINRGARNGFSVAELAQAGGYEPTEIRNAADYATAVNTFNMVAESSTESISEHAASDPTPESNIHRNADQLIDQITADDGTTRKFGYNGKTEELISVTNPDGITYTVKDGTWVDADGKPAPFSNVTVDQRTGVVSFTRNDGSGLIDQYSPDGHKSVITSDGSPAKDLTPEQLKAIDDIITAELIEQSRARAGEGYIRIAARLLGKPNANDSDPEVARLYKELAALNGNKPLHPGDAVLTPEILAQITDPALKALIQKEKDDAIKADERQKDQI